MDPAKMMHALRSYERMASVAGRLKLDLELLLFPNGDAHRAALRVEVLAPAKDGIVGARNIEWEVEASTALSAMIGVVLTARKGIEDASSVHPALREWCAAVVG